MHGEEMFVAIMLPLSFFLLVFGIVYMQKKENLALIEKGINPKETYSRPAPFKNLKWALLLIGAGAGLLVAYILDETLFRRIGSYISDNGTIHYYHHNDNPVIYFSLIAIGGGLGLFGSYWLERKWLEKREAMEK